MPVGCVRERNLHTAQVFAWRNARGRLGVAPLWELFRTTVRPLAQSDTPGTFYRGFRLVAIDGVVYNTPDTEVNEKAFERPPGGDRGPGAFPQLRKVSLVEVGSHVELAFVLKRIACGETTAVEGLWRHIGAESLLLEDRGFFSYKQWKRNNRSARNGNCDGSGRSTRSS